MWFHWILLNPETCKVQEYFRSSSVLEKYIVLFAQKICSIARLIFSSTLPETDIDPLCVTFYAKTTQLICSGCHYRWLQSRSPTNRSKEMENCNRVLREEQRQPTEPSWLQISPKTRVTFKDAGKEGFVTTRRHFGEQMTVCVTFTITQLNSKRKWSLLIPYNGNATSDRGEIDRDWD